MRRKDTVLFKSINVDKAQKIAGRSAQDTNFHSYNARLTYPRGSNQRAGDFNLFKIPEGYKEWQFNVDEKGVYRSDAVCLVRPHAPFNLLTSIESATRQKIETAGVSAFAHYQPAYQVNYLLPQETSARQKTLTEESMQFLLFEESVHRKMLANEARKARPSLVYFNRQKVRIEERRQLIRAENNARARIIKARAEQLQPIVNAMNFSLNAANEALNERLKTVRVEAATFLLGEHIKFQAECLKEFKVLRSIYEVRERILQQKEVAELQIMSQGEITSRNTITFLQLILDHYDALSRNFFPRLNGLFLQLSLIPLPKKNEGANCFEFVANVDLLREALRKVIAKKDSLLNATLIYEAVKNLKANSRFKTTFDHPVFKAVDMSDLTRFLDHPLFDVDPFPFSHQLTRSFKSVFQPIRFLYYYNVLCNFLYNSSELREQLSKKRSVMKELYYFLLNSVENGVPASDAAFAEKILTFDPIVEIPDHHVVKMQPVSDALSSSARLADCFFKAHIRSVVLEPLCVQPAESATCVGPGFGLS